jgi:hypothetical protein
LLDEAKCQAKIDWAERAERVERVWMAHPLDRDQKRLRDIGPGGKAAMTNESELLRLYWGKRRVQRRSVGIGSGKMGSGEASILFVLAVLFGGPVGWRSWSSIIRARIIGSHGVDTADRKVFCVVSDA